MGASPFVLLQLGGLGTGLSPHFTRGGAGTRPGQPPLSPFPVSWRVHAVVACMDRCLPAPSFPPSLRRCVRDPLRVAADSASLRHLGWEKHPPSPCHRNNGEPPGLPRISRNSNRDERDLLPSKRKMLPFWKKKQIDAFKWLLLPLGGATLVQVLSSLPSVASVPLLNDSRRN